MKTVQKIGAQGDVLFIRMPEDFKIPSGYKEMSADEAGHLVLAHSETGHNHVMEKRPDVKAYIPTDFDNEGLFDIYVEVGSSENVELKHLRDYDTHGSWMFTPGTYVFKPQREYTPEKLRRAID